MPLFRGYNPTVARLFGGAPDPRLSDQQNANASREGLIRAGLATIIGSGAGGMSPIQAIAAGLLEGQGAAQQNRADTWRTSAQQQMADIAADGGPTQEVLTKMFTQAVSSGDVETMKALSGILPTVLSSGRSNRTTRTETVQMPDGAWHQIVLDASTGETIRDLGPAEPTNVFEREFVEPSADSPTGALRIGIRRGTGERVVLGLAEPSGGAGGSAQERMNANLLTAAESALVGLNEIGTSLTGLGGAAAEMARRPGVMGMVFNWATPDQAQQANTLGLQFISPIVRILSGAQMNEQEASRYAAAFLERAGDRPETVAAKIRGRNELVAALRGGQGPKTPAEFGDFLAQYGLRPLAVETYNAMLRDGPGSSASPTPGGSGLFPSRGGGG